MTKRAKIVKIAKSREGVMCYDIFIERENVFVVCRGCRVWESTGITSWFNDIVNTIRDEGVDEAREAYGYEYVTKEDVDAIESVF